jgi:hypothetical protein
VIAPCLALARPLAGAVLVLACACSTRPGYTNVMLANDEPQIENEAYQQNLERFTRWHSSYDSLDTRVFLAATWQSWPLRRSRVAAEADFRSLTRTQAAALLAKEIVEARTYTDVFLGIYTPKLEWNDLSSRRSIWHIEMESVPGGAVEPLEVERYERPDANLRALYPYLSPFWIGYRLRFPGPPPGPKPTALVLRLASAVAKVETTWELAGVEPPPPEEAPAPAPGPSP